jgi:hypothetical protein
MTNENAQRKKKELGIFKSLFCFDRQFRQSKTSRMKNRTWQIAFFTVCALTFSFDLSKTFALPKVRFVKKLMRLLYFFLSKVNVA